MSQRKIYDKSAKRIPGASRIEAADPDSHFRLRPCENCGGTNAAYVFRRDKSGESWHAECFDCGHKGRGSATRHGAQVLWSGAVLEAAV
jgi:hypothetical protein